MSESIPSARGAGKRRADPHAERTPETADVARVERDRAAGDGSPPPKRKSRLADAVAEASGASSYLKVTYIYRNTYIIIQH